MQLSPFSASYRVAGPVVRMSDLLLSCQLRQAAEYQLVADTEGSRNLRPDGNSLDFGCNRTSSPPSYVSYRTSPNR